MGFFTMTLTLKCLSLLSFLLAIVSCMDFGGAGVWDSPMAIDVYVKQFGWLFGGGRSGMAGIKAMEREGVDKKGMKYNNPYDYEGEKGTKSLKLFPMPSMEVLASRTKFPTGRPL